MLEDQRRRAFDVAQRDAEKIGDAEIDRHAHAVHGAAQCDAIAIELDTPHATVGAGIARFETRGK